MLGSFADAEDLLQDAYLRWHETDRSGVRVEEAFLVTMVTRLALDRLRRARLEREAYPGQWLPEPWLEGGMERGDDLSYAAQVLLERLTPDERAAFLLREAFELDYALISEAVEKSEAACRKLVQRANERLAEAGQGAPPRQAASREEQTQLLAQFLAASRAQDPAILTRLLVPEARYVTDGGGKVFAARYVLEGAERIARALWRIARKAAPFVEDRLVDLPDGPAIATFHGRKLYSLAFIASRGGQIEAIYKLLNPEKLRRAAAALVDKP